jgi:hypothetical protein
MSTTPSEFRPGAAGRVRQYLAVAAVLLTLFLSACSHKSLNQSAPVASKQGRKTELAVGRKVYRLSVVPGGVSSAEELREARMADDVVAAHYQDFGPAKRDRLASDSLMYVSYRVGDKIFWTAKRHRIRTGEAVLSDGKNLARVRCGNRLSATPRKPVDSQKEPTEVLLGELQPPDMDFLTKKLEDPTLTAPEMDFEIGGAEPGPNLSLFPTLSPQMKVPGLGSLANGGGLPSFFSIPAPSPPLNTGTSGSSPSGNNGGSGGGTSNPTDPGGEGVSPEPPTAILCPVALLLLLYLPARAGIRTRRLP